MRIVSLLPSTTEILFAIGAGDDVVGVTFECDYPAEARERRIVSTSAMPEGLTPAEIDAYVVGAMSRGEDLYHLDEGALAGLDADLVVTQDLCAVCAVDVSVVDDALAHLGCTAEVLTIDPHTLDEVLDSIRDAGQGDRPRGRGRRAGGRLSAARLDAVRARVAGRPRPRVMLLEWTDPPFAPGHWVPGDDRGRRRRAAARHARREVGAGDLGRRPRRRAGADRGRAVRLRPRRRPTARRRPRASGVLPAGVPCTRRRERAWARPGTRLVDGVEELAALLHPDPT